MDSFLTGLTRVTERFLSWRKKRRYIAKEKQRRRHPVVDWLDALIWAAGVVLLINQYLFQAYVIPSPSMTDTLNVGDRLFVNKLVYGPELIPGRGKLPGFVEPKRTDIIIFESPEYISRGPAFDILQRVIYMLTFSFVDIDRQEDGTPRAHFLIKRAIGLSGDRFRYVDGETEILARGASDWENEIAWMRANDYYSHVTRLTRRDDYPAMVEAARAAIRKNYGLHLGDTADLQSVSPDYYTLSESYAAESYAINPQEFRLRNANARYRVGWYVPPGYIFPMGDNRDNSKDARSFGAVAVKNVLGRAAVRYWPLARLGGIQ